LSPTLAASSIVRGARSALPPREALILLALTNHPWLLEHHAEEFSRVEFDHPDADQLRRAVLDISAEHAPASPEELRKALEKRELGALLAHMERAVTHPADWPARAGAAPDDVNQWWVHVLTLHTKARTLHKELKEAERALGDDPNDQNYAWLRDVQGRLSALDGTEAAIEGFGALSGRPVRNL
jgi:DNA primase